VSARAQQRDEPTAEDLDLVDPDALDASVADDAELWRSFAADDKQQQSATEAPDDGGDQDAAAADDAEPETATEDADAQQPAGEDDIWSGASAAQREAFEALKAEKARLEQAERSQRGRISAFQRQIEDLRRQPSPEATAATDKGAAESTGEPAADFLGSDKWKTFAEEYPEIAEPLGEVISGLRSETTRLHKELAAVGDERREAALQQQEQLLVEAHPDWLEVTDDAAFVDWLGAQPRHVREAAQRNFDAIVDADEAADVVGRFKAWRAAERGESQPAAAGGGKPPNPNPALTSRRKRQLESATAVRSRQPSAAAGIPDDPEQAWKAFERMGL